jgi:hypothetical protein
MRLDDLVAALLRHDTLAARQWVNDAGRERFDWSTAPAPLDRDPLALAVAAGVAELLARRAGQAPPGWAQTVPALAEPFLLVQAAARLPRLRRACEEEGPEPLRRRRLLAPPEFLTAA